MHLSHSSESSLMQNSLFVTNITFLHQIQQNGQAKTESKIPSLELVWCFISNWIYALYLPNKT